MKVLKCVGIIFGSLLALVIITILVAILKTNIKTSQILDDYSGIYSDPKYQNAVSVHDVALVKQDISCGYAVIEMYAKWSKNENITEESLYDEYGGVVTSTGQSFETEMNKRFPEYKTTMYRYLKNTELIDATYTSLSNGVPVPFEWAAKYDNEWTLHYSLITGMDISNDLVTILNPYGYEEKTTISEFLDRTSFKAYENMPIFLELGFAFDIFEKNTIFIVEKK